MMRTPPAEPPAFAAPWQAQLFAMTVALHEAGRLDWGCWSARLGRELAADGGDPEAIPRDGRADERYWRCWASALEGLLVDEGLAPPLVLASLRQAWRVCAEKTPHGEPLHLNRAALRMAGIDDTGSGDTPR